MLFRSSSEDLLSRSPVHAGARDGVDYGGGAKHEFWQNLDWFGVGYNVGQVHVAHV